jgi:hypothetical protein
MHEFKYNRCYFTNIVSAGVMFVNRDFRERKKERKKERKIEGKYTSEHLNILKVMKSNDRGVNE